MERITIAAVGDILLHENILRSCSIKKTYSFYDRFSEIAPLLKEADVAIANQESIVAGPDYGISSYPKFNSPVEIVDDLKSVGFGVLNVANNHMLDKGEKALIASLHNIKRAGLSYTGGYISEGDVERDNIHVLGGVRLAFISFTDGSKIKAGDLSECYINNFPGESQPVRLVRKISKIKKEIKRVQKKSDVIILQLHFGEEYHRFPSAFQRELVSSLCETGVDVIIGHHPHVLQPIEWVENSRGKKVLIAYSLGNFFSGQQGIYRQIGGVFRFSVSKINVGNRSVFTVESPSFDLTYVDVKDDFNIKWLADVSCTETLIHSSGNIWVDGGDVYKKMLDHMSAYCEDLKVQ